MARKQTTRMRKIECFGCGCIVRMTRAAMERSGVPTCGCGGTMMPEDIEDAAAVLDDATLSQHPQWIADMEREDRAAQREARRGGLGARFQCGGCCRFIPTVSHGCGCGFQNAIVGRRNRGYYAEGASYCAESKRDTIPF